MTTPPAPTPPALDLDAVERTHRETREACDDCRGSGRDDYGYECGSCRGDGLSGSATCAVFALVAEVPRLVARVRELERLVYCARHADDPAVLALVTPAALEAWLVARGWEADEERPHGVLYRFKSPRHGWETALVSREPTWRDYARCVHQALRDAERVEGDGAFHRFDALAALLPPGAEAITTTATTEVPRG